MSRIHDALRKAEQDRTAGLPPEKTDARSEPADRQFTPILPPALEPGREGQRPAGDPILGLDLADGMTLEGWMVECPQSPWKPDPRTVLFGNSGAAHLGVEEFRTLRTQLSQMREKLPLQTLLVTSSLAGEGKTFVALNLAQAFVQQHGRRVLLIDADLRLSKLHGSLGAQPTPGLTDFLRGTMGIARILQRGIPENLFFIPGGNTVSNPIELLG
ncbi:MAG: CpsD/CapB family tyrosine-protein kinase, partial [Terriglobia bacterium]